MAKPCLPANPHHSTTDNAMTKKAQTANYLTSTDKDNKGKPQNAISTDHNKQTNQTALKTTVATTDTKDPKSKCTLPTSTPQPSSNTNNNAHAETTSTTGANNPTSNKQKQKTTMAPTSTDTTTTNKDNDDASAATVTATNTTTAVVMAKATQNKKTCQSQLSTHGKQLEQE